MKKRRKTRKTCAACGEKKYGCRTRFETVGLCCPSCARLTDHRFVSAVAELWRIERAGR
jgi:hypothetical protein